VNKLLTKTWRIVLLVVILVGVLFSDLIGPSTWWVVLVAIVVLLIAEINCDSCDMSSKIVHKRTSRKRTGRVAKKRR
jgi:hypothetical protein